MNDLWIPATLVFLAAVFTTFSLAFVTEAVREWWRRRLVARRLKPVLSGRMRKLGGDVSQELVLSAKASNPLASLLGLGSLGQLLEQARLDWGVGTFLILMAGVGFGSGLAAFAISGSIVISLVCVLLGSWFPYLFVNSRRKRRFRQFEEEFPEAIDLLTRAIRAGHPFSAGMQMVADEGPAEVSREFRQAFEEQRYGLPFEEALMGMVDRTDLVDVKIFSIAILIQREVGGNLAEILDNLAHVIRRRFYIRRQLRVYTAQGRMTGYALAALPVVVGSIIFLMQPEYVGLLFTNLLGQVMLGTALVLQVIGAFWIRKIIDIDI